MGIDCGKRCVDFVYNLLFTQFYIGTILKNCFVDRDSATDDSIQKPQFESLSPSQPNTTSVDCVDRTDPNPQVRYSVYSLQSEA